MYTNYKLKHTPFVIEYIKCHQQAKNFGGELVAQQNNKKKCKSIILPKLCLELVEEGVFSLKK